MWRVLKVGGLFVVISTMPPEIIEPLALAPLLDPSGTKRVSNWNRGSTERLLTTQEGGKVYYYAITKLADIARKSSFRPAAALSASSSLSPTKSKGTKKAADNSDIMAGISALLDEAKRAKENMEAATNKVRIHDTLFTFSS